MFRSTGGYKERLMQFFNLQGRRETDKWVPIGNRADILLPMIYVPIKANPITFVSDSEIPKSVVFGKRKFVLGRGVGSNELAYFEVAEQT